MGFTTISYNETQSGFIWEVNWDGAFFSPTLKEQRSYWDTSITFSTQDNGNGTTMILGVDLTGQHKKGPHTDDWGRAAEVNFRLNPIDILGSVGTQDHGNKTASHSLTTGGKHPDLYHVKSHTLVNSSGVKITFEGTHNAQLPSSTGGAIPPTTGTIPVSTPIEPPRKGTCKDFTMIDGNTEGNYFISLCGLFTASEVEVNSVKDLVDKILSSLGEEECIGTLTIIGHGSPGYINVGNGQTGKTAGKSISVVRPEYWRKELMRLRCKFCEDSKVVLYGCNVGAGSRGARLLFMLNQIFQCAGCVEAKTGTAYGTHTSGETQSSKRGDKSAPLPLANPDKGKTKKKSKTGGSIGAQLFSAALKNNHFLTFEPLTINRVQVLSGELAGKISPKLFADPEVTRELSKNMVSVFQSYLSESVLESSEGAGFAIDGLVQFWIEQDNESVPLPPMAILGGGRYLSPDWKDISLLFVMADEIADLLSSLFDE